jgi:TPP-dependent pyruvate/acetoin dehydrogenase alpha subunit
MGNVETGYIEAWDDDDYRRATGLLTVLGEDGTAKVPAPQLDPQRWRDAFRTMLRIRAFDRRAAALVKAERVPAHPRAEGLEAVLIGGALALEPDDVIVPGLYAAAAGIHRGAAVGALADQLFGNENDLAAGRQLPGFPALPRGTNVLPGTPLRGTHLAHATGVAWAMRMRQKPGSPSKVALAYLDVPATSAEDFHAGLNFAGVYRAPVVFLCANQGGDPAVPETVSATIAVKAFAYGFAGVRVDGCDLLAVLAATQAAVERARAGGGATLIEAVVAREVTDPLDQLGGWLAAQKILDPADQTALRGEVDKEIDVAFAAEESVGPPSRRRLIEDVYARPSAALEDALDALERIQKKT